MGEKTRGFRTSASKIATTAYGYSKKIAKKNDKKKARREYAAYLDEQARLEDKKNKKLADIAQRNEERRYGLAGVIDESQQGTE